MVNCDTSSLSLSRTMFKDMVEFVISYRLQYHRNPMTIYIDKEHVDFISFNKFEEIKDRYKEFPIIIPINMED